VRLPSRAIADQGTSTTIEIVRGRLDDETASELRSFWAAQTAMDDAEAQRRLPEVVCVLRGADGSIAGACSAFAGELALVGNRRFFVLRTLLPGDARDRLFDMFAAAWRALDAEYDGAPGEPIGVCLLLEERERLIRPQAEWQDPRTIYAGYAADGRQVRLAYFSAALSASTWPVPPEYEVVLFATQDAVSADDVIALWTAEAGLTAAEARRRVDELLFVATDKDGRLAGVSTRYLQHNAQLRMDLWYYRAFVAAAHRRSFVATELAVLGREHLEAAYVSGRDTRAAGLIYEVESEILKQLFPNAVWFPADVIYIGDSPSGAHVRVHYFAGAQAPG
jgi:hypothetical protein